MKNSLRFLNIYILIYVFFLYAPIMLLPLFSLNDSAIATFPIRGLTISWYKKLLQDETLLSAVWSSVLVAAVVAVVSTGLGVMAAMGLTRGRLPGRSFAMAIFLLPLVVPPIVLGVALLTLFRKILGFELSLLTVAIGHVLICLPYSILVLIARFESFDVSLEEASMDLGQSPLQTFRRITFPLVRPGVVASLLLTSVVSFDEFLIAFFLSGTEPTLPIVIWGSLRFPSKLPITLALGSVILIVTVALVVFAEIYRRKNVASDFLKVSR